MLPLTSLPAWKYINKSHWISVSVLADRERAPLWPSETLAGCFVLAPAGGLIWMLTPDPQTLSVVTEMDLSFWCAQFFFVSVFVCVCVCERVCVLFPNWINWSNGRLSHPPCHAFYLSLIALSFSASICLSTFRQHLWLLPLLSSLSVKLSHKGRPNFYFYFLYSFFLPLSAVSYNGG